MLQNYFKLDGPDWVWWLGVVESRGDVTLAGRYQVRIFGYHTDDIEVLPTKDLPYATCIQPVTSASTSGIMESPSLVPGSTVVGFFADGKEGQMPVIMGAIAGKPAPGGGPDNEDAFNDPNKKYPRGMWSGPPEGYAGVGEPDISKLARDEDAEGHYSLIQKRAEREVDIRTASAPSLQEDGLFDDKEGKDYAGAMWEEPHARAMGPYKTFEKKEFEPKYWDALGDLKSGGDGKPKEPGEYTSLYPYNNVKETESGFIEEFDNTGEHFRYAWHSPMGNFEEHQMDGTKVEKIKGDDYEIVVKDKNVLIRGSCNVTVMGDCKMLVQGDKYEEVEGDYFLSVFGDRITKINGSDMKVVMTDQNYSIAGNRACRVTLNDNLEVMGKQDQKISKDKNEVVSGDVTEKFLSNQVNEVGKNRITTVTETDKVKIGKNQFVGVGEKMELGSGLDMTLKTLENQIIEVAKFQTMTMGADESTDDDGNTIPATTGRQTINVKGGGTHNITAQGHSSINNNVTIDGTTHSTGDVSTDAGNAPTLATHTHKHPPGSGSPSDTTVADA